MSQPKSNPYDTLGVHASCNADEIKRAYKNKARTAHPDAGGNHESFVALQRAYATVGNEQARERYDQTGCTADELTPQEKATRILTDMLIRVVDAIRDPETENVVEVMRHSIEQNMDSIPQTIAMHERKARKFRIAAKRLKVKSGSTELTAILEAQATASKQLAKACEDELDTGRELLKQLQEWEYSIDQQPIFSNGPPSFNSLEALRQFLR